MNLTPRNFAHLFAILMLAFPVMVLGGPSQPVRAKNDVRTPRLSHVLAQVNGEARAIRAGDQMDLIAGDVLRLKAAVLDSPEVSVKERTAVVSHPRVSLNFIGVPGRNPDRVWDDIGQDINTALDVVPAHAVSRLENIYEIRAEIFGKSVGSVFVRIFPPRLAFAEILVNGSARMMRDGEILVVAPSDQVKLTRFESNVANAADVGFRFQKASGQAAVGGQGVRAPYEFVFFRGGRVFARVPVRVEATSSETVPVESKD